MRLLSLLFVFASLALHAAEVARTPLPDWVEPVAVELDAPDPEGGASDGMYYLLLDDQNNVGEATRFSHSARRFINESGVQENSRVSIDFEPSYQTLAFHTLRLHRAGAILDRLATQEIKLLQRETRLDRHLYDGRLSAVLILEDVRPGDVLEVAYSIRGANPIFAGKYSNSFTTHWSVPLRHFRHREFWPIGRRIEVKAHDAGLESRVKTHDGLHDIVWEKRDLPALASDGDTPSWFDPWGWVELSEWTSWNEVARWAAEIHAMPPGVPAALESDLAEIRMLSDPAAQAMAALRHVQRSIRYLGLETGVNSHRPYPLETVLQRRFGDCKDKARFLTALLRGLGLEAHPALVETDYRHTIAGWLPTPSAFDHVVVQVRLGGRTYWLDPTRSEQGGTLDTVFFPDYGRALVIDPEATALAEVTPSGFDQSGTQVEEVYRMEEYSGGTTLSVITRYRGAQADSMRTQLTEQTIAEFQRSYLDFYARQYPDIAATAAPTFTDDHEKNEIVGTESYRLENLWLPRDGEAGKLYASFYPQSVRDQIQRPDRRVRTMPIGLAHPRDLTQTIRIHFPEHLDFEKSRVRIENPAFTYASHTAPSARQLELVYSYKSHAPAVAAEAVPQYLGDVRRVLDDLGYDLWVHAPGAAPAAAEPIPAVTPGPAFTFSATVLLLLTPFAILGFVALALLVRGSMKKSPPPISTAIPPPLPLHRCARCGATDITRPDLEFRVGADGSDRCENCRPLLPLGAQA